jgi:TolA-binding protein
LITPAWATPADDLYNKGVAYLSNEKYDDAAATFAQLVAGYPTGAHVDDARISGGFAYLHAGKYQQGIDFLAPLATNTMAEKASYKATALYFTALAQFSMGQAEKDKAKASANFAAAATTYSSLIDICTKTPTADNKSYLEPSIYYRALANYLREDYPAAEKDLIQVIKQFPNSLSIPDYWLRLGSAYGVETNNAVQAKASPDEIRERAQKSIDAYTQVSIDPNALVQANQANMEMGEILFMIAQLDPENGAGYRKALDAYRKVRRKEDMIPIQQERINQLKVQIQNELRTAGASAASYSNEASLLIGREEDRLNSLKSEADPIYQALIRMAECYVNLKQPNEARTILHRLAHAQLTPEQQQEVDFQTLYSYVLGGQTDQADKALTDYLTKHGSDPNADSISYQIASELQKRHEYDGALKQALRSMKDFPKGKFADDALILEASILTSLNRIDESNKIVDDYLKANPTSPKANNLLITRGLNKMNATPPDYVGALADLGKVKDNAGATPEVRGAADASYVQVLSKQKNYDGVIAEAKNFATQYKDSPALSSVLLFSGMALAEKHDPGAIAALQEIAKNYPKDEAAPFALFTVVNIYAQTGDVKGMTTAFNNLRTAFPTAYSILVQAADTVTTVLEKRKDYADAIALYEPLTQVSKKDVAAAARNKIGTIWLDAAHSMGYYSSLPPTRPAGDPLARPGADRAEADKRLAAAEQSFLQTLKDFPDESNAAGDAIDGLVAVAKQRRTWGLLKDADMEKYLDGLTSSLTAPDIQARLEMAKAGLVFIQKNGASQFPAALDRYKKVVAANPALVLGRQEADQLGQLAIAAGDYATAQSVYGSLLDNAPANDVQSKGYGYFGLGAVLSAQGKVADAKVYYQKLEALPGGGAWHPRINEADYGIALGDESSTDPGTLEEAKKIYATLMHLPPGNYVLAAKAMLGYGRILEKQGFALKPNGAGPTEYAIHYYQQPNVMSSTGTPQQSAEGLFDAGQAYEKLGDKANAKAQYDLLIQTYGTYAPDWAAKAKDAESKLGV